MATAEDLLIRIDATTETLRRELKKAEIGSGAPSARCKTLSRMRDTPASLGAPVRTMQNLYGIRRRSI